MSEPYSDVFNKGGGNVWVKVGEDLRQLRAEADLDGHLPRGQLPGDLHPRAGEDLRLLVQPSLIKLDFFSVPGIQWIGL